MSYILINLLTLTVSYACHPKQSKSDSNIQQEDTTVNGTLHTQHVVVKEFQKRGFRWGHTFTKYLDDHHFEYMSYYN